MIDVTTNTGNVQNLVAIIEAQGYRVLRAEHFIDINRSHLTIAGDDPHDPNLTQKLLAIKQGK